LKPKPARCLSRSSLPKSPMSPTYCSFKCAFRSKQQSPRLHFPPPTAPAGSCNSPQ
jgi:hypothetical protein